MSISASSRFFTKKLYATTVLAASVFAIGTPAHAAGLITPGAHPAPGSFQATTPVVTGTFVAGSGTFTNTPGTTDITVNTSSSIINFPEYNIGAGQTVHYGSTVGSATNLSRVTGSDPSSILGTLSSTNVTVYLVNPNGVFFGKNATVNVPNLVVSSSDITNKNFTAGNLDFNIQGKSNAQIVNDGTITVSDTGLAALVAPTVINNGLIVAKRGKVALAAGDQFTVDPYGDNLINFAVSNSENTHLVQQSGKIAAEGGVVLLTAQDTNKVVNNVVNLDGVVEANAVKIKGDTITLGDAAVINTSSKHSGGKVSIQGSNITIAKNAKIKSEALVDGNGGDVNIDAVDLLSFDGSISAKGAGTGAGGTVETSGDQIAFGNDLSVSTIGENGNAGLWFIDPSNFTIDDNGYSIYNHLNANVLAGLLDFTNITIATSAAGNQPGDINVNSNVIKTFGGDTTLTLQAADDINIKSGVEIGSTSNKLNVNLDANNNVTIDGTVNTNGGSFKVANKAGTGDAANFNLSANSTLNTGSGAVTIDATAASLNSLIAGTGIISGDVKTVDVVSNAASINQGIDIAKSGGTVDVGAGTYDENVYINKNLILNGAGQGKTIITGSNTSGNSFQDFYDNTYNDAVILVQNAVADVDNLTVDGSGKTAAAGHRVVGIGYNNAGGNVNSVTVQNVDTGLVAQTDTSIITTTSYRPAQTVAVTSSTIQDFASNGILANGNLLTANLGGNGGNFVKGSSTALIGEEIGRDALGQVGNTTFLGFNANGADEISLYNAGNSVDVHDNNLAYGNSGTTGIAISGGDYEQVSNNTVYGNTTGISADSSDNLLIGTDDVENNTNGIYITNSLNSIINNSTVSNNADGIDIRNSDNGLVQSSTINNNSVYGIYAQDSNGFTVNNDTLSGNTQFGVRLKGGANELVENSTISGSQTGVEADGTASVSVSTNQITGNSNTGVNLNESESATVENNTISNNGIGVGVIYSDNAVIGTDAINNNTTGVSISNSLNAIINNSTINSNSADGVDVANSSNNALIQSSTIENSGNYGVYVQNSDSAVLNNVKDYNNYIGAEFQTSNSSTVENSSFYNNSYGVIGDNAGTLTISGSAFYNNGLGINLVTSDNALLSNNNVYDNEYGIILSSSNNGTVNNNNVYGNIIGIYFDNSNGGLLENSNVYSNTYGVYGLNTVGLQVTGTNIDQNNQGAILVSDSGTQIVDSTIYANTNNGVTSDSSTNLLISGSQIYGNNNGVVTSASTGFTINGNSSVYNNTVDGIALNNGSNSALVLDDFIYGNGTGVSVSSSDNAVIGSSQIHNNTTGVNISDSLNAIINNSNVNYNTTGVNLVNSNNALIQSSSVSYNTADGVDASASTGLTINGVNVIGNSGDGIYLASASNNATVENSQIYDNVNGINANASTNLTVNGASDIYDNSNNGINLANGSDNATISGDDIYDNQNNGIAADTSNYLLVNANTNIHNNTNDGISLADGSNYATVSGSSIHDNQNNGIAADASSYLMVNADTNIYNNTNAGVSLAGSSNYATIISSLIYNNTNGIVANGSDQLTVNGSNVYDNNGNGISIANSSFYATVSGDNIYGNQNGVVADASDYLTVNDNTNVYNNSNDGILLQNSSLDANIINAAIHDNTANGVEIDSGSNNASLTNDNIYNNLGGLVLNASTGGTITGSTVSNNPTGISISNGGGLTINSTAINGGTSGLVVNGARSEVAFTGTTNQFNGQSGQYITLTNYAMGGQDLSIKNVTLDGIVANNNTSDADSFALEDKIHHEMDENNVGLVTWKDNNVYATLNNLGIQQGVNVIGDGGIVNIAAGQYNENVDVPYGITLIGRDMGNDASVDTIINGGSGTAVNVHAGSEAVTLDNLTVTTSGSQYAVLVDGSVTQTLQSGYVSGGVETAPGIFVGGTFVPTGPVVVISGPTSEPIDFNMNNVLYTGTQTEAALQFQNGTTTIGSTSSGVQFASTAPNGWRFLNISGDAPKNSLNVAAGDMDFGNTVFQNTYGQDIRLTNSTIDGDAYGVNFEGTGTPAEIENLVYHVHDNSALGTIFYDGFDLVEEASNLGSFDTQLDREIADVYYNSVSTAGRIYDSPALTSARVKTFNPTNDTRVSISAAAPSVINLPTASAAQVAGLAPASGNSQQPLTKEAGVKELQAFATTGQDNNTGLPLSTNNGPGAQSSSINYASASAASLNNLQSAAGGNTTAASLNNLQTASGPNGLPRQLAANCSVSFGNNFLADSVGTVSGACQ